jgi:hypothetical protein
MHIIHLLKFSYPCPAALSALSTDVSLGNNTTGEIYINKDSIQWDEEMKCRTAKNRDRASGHLSAKPIKQNRPYIPISSYTAPHYH